MCALLLAIALLFADVCPCPRRPPGLHPPPRPPAAWDVAPTPVRRPGVAQFELGDTARSTNFIVHAPDAALAQQVADWAEAARTAIGKRLSAAGQTEPIADSRWPRAVTITVYRDHPGYFATEFGRDGMVSITLWASDLHLESTVRHEVCHAVLHLRYPNRLIPRWFDEGLAVCQETPLEQERQLAPLLNLLPSPLGGEGPGVRGPRFSIRQLAGLTEYPREVGLFYAQSYSLVDFLIERHGERDLLRFLEVSFQIGQEKALQQVLGYGSFEDLDQQWWGNLKKN